MSCPKCESYINQIIQLQKELEELRAIKLVRFNNEDCWLWQGDGFDYPESLTCPVVMHANTLRELISKRDRGHSLLDYIHKGKRIKALSGQHKGLYGTVLGGEDHFLIIKFENPEYKDNWIVDTWRDNIQFVD